LKVELQVYKIESFTVISLNGKIDSSNSDGAEAEVSNIIGKGDKNFIFDLGKLEYISSAGLRVFLTASKKIKNEKGNFIICNASEEINEIFDITGLLNVFVLCPSLEKAVEKLKLLQ